MIERLVNGALTRRFQSSRIKREKSGEGLVVKVSEKHKTPKETHSMKRNKNPEERGSIDEYV